MRKLASIRKISKLSPIEGADRILVARVDGWDVVVGKDVGHEEGDWVVYCEIDSFLPIEPEFEFLRKSSYKKLADGSEGFRLKTIKLRGQISQGLIIPIDDAREIIKRHNVTYLTFKEGQDVSELMGIIKYDPPLPAQLSGKAKGYFPSFIPKTDEERVQNLGRKYDELAYVKLFVTEKLDGSSATFFINDGEFGVCSRNLELARPDEEFVSKEVECQDGKMRMTQENSFWKAARELDLENKLKSLSKIHGSELINNVAIQGELIGEGIQKNPYKIKGQTVRFFNAFDIDRQERLSPGLFISLIKSMGLETVPVIDTEFELPNSIDDLVKLADGPSKLNPDASREGLVIRSQDGSISFKVISNKFLENEE